MTLEDILKLSPAEQYTKLSVKSSLAVSEEDILNQINPSKHKVFKETFRPKKKIKTYAGKDEKGEDKYVDSLQEVNRVAIPFQELIVNRRVGFTLGNPVQATYTATKGKEMDLINMINKVLDDNKMSFFDRKLARALFTECEVAELWYLDEDSEYWDKSNVKLRPRVKLLKPSEGNKLIPFFNGHGKMVAFSREYIIIENDKRVTVLDTYTNKYKITYKKIDGAVSVDKKTHNYNKIPVIYYSQKYPEWYKVQVMVERLETLVSNFADTNDYFGSPMIVTHGQVNGFASKGEQGKMLKVEKGGKVEYLSWDHAPDSIKLEIETLIELIYTCTQTPNISFSQMKGMGNLSGIALKLMFLDAHMGVEDKVEVLGEMFQRRLNLLKTMCGEVADSSLSEAVKSLHVKPVFTPYLPRNEKEEIETLTTAAGGNAIMSQRTAIKNNVFVMDPKEEWGLIQEEAKADAFNPTE